MRVLLLVLLGLSACHKNKPDTKLSTFIGSPPPAEFKEPGFERQDLVVHMTRSYLEQFPNWPRNVTEGARFEKTPDGWKIVRIKEDSIYHKLGFRNNDLILSPADVESGLKAGQDFTVVFIRSEAKKTLEIHVTR